MLDVDSYQNEIRLVECPLSWCGHEFDNQEPRWKHYLTEHLPEDFGLTPLGEMSP